MSPRTQGVTYEEKHVEVLKAAAALFAHRDFHKTSVRDLARATRRSLSGLYYYFASKEELLYQIQHHCYATLLESVETALAGLSTPHEKLLTFISHHVGYFRRHMDEMKVLAHEDLTLGGEYGQKILELKRRYSQVLVDIIRAYAAREGRERELPSPEMGAFILFGMMNWLYTWPKRLRSRPPEEVAEAIAQIFLCGYPGCTASDQATLRDQIQCSGQRFWKTAGSGHEGGT